MKTNYTILAMNGPVIICNGSTTSFDPIVLKDGVYYDPKDNFRPIDPKPKQKTLSPGFVEMALPLIEEARQSFIPAEETATPSAESSSSAPATSTPAPAQQTTAPQTDLSTTIAQSLANLSLGTMMETARPMIDDYIIRTYGPLPKTIEVKTEFGKVKVGGITGKHFETALKLVAANIPTFLAGPAGCGKNVICKQIAEALKLEFYFSNAVTQEYKLTGFIDANGHYQKTQFFEAFTNGGLFMLDEIDASTPEVLVILNAAIANGYFDFPTGRVEAHKDFRIIAAGNTFGTGADSEYTGRFQLDASSLDRFAILEVGYEKEVEKALSGNNDEILNFIYDFRKAVKKANILFTVSYRSIERLRKLTSILDEKQAVQLAVLRGLEIEDTKMILRNMATTSNRYTSALGQLVG